MTARGYGYGFDSRTNEDTERLEDELYQAGRAWGLAGNTGIPKTYLYDRGDGTSVPIHIQGLGGVEFVRGWKETRPAPKPKGKKK